MPDWRLFWRGREPEPLPDELQVTLGFAGPDRDVPIMFPPSPAPPGTQAFMERWVDALQEQARKVS